MRIFWKIYLTTVAVVLLSVGMVTAAVSLRETERGLERLRAKQKLLAEIAASQVEAGYQEQIWPLEMLNRISTEGAVAFWEVRDETGKQVLSQPANIEIADWRLPPNDYGATLLPGPTPTIEIWNIPLRMRTDGAPWSFRLGFDTDGVRSMVQSMIWHTVGYAVAVSLLLAPLLWILARRTLRPLQSLTRAAKELEAGTNLTVDLEPGRDELGQLVTAFAAMADRIRERDERIYDQIGTIQRSRSELEIRVIARTRELEKAKAAAEVANASKSEFLANMSHEIRTPMTAILGFAEVVLMSSRDEETRDAVSIIKRNGEHLLQIINDILDISKIEAGRLEVESVPFSVLEVLSEVRSLMQIRVEGKNLYFQLEFDGPIPETITGDPTRLKQILINLTGNAVKFTESGGIRLLSRVQDWETLDARLEMDIIDTGIGLEEKQASRLFRPFAQADASTTRLYGGTGLGLAISRRLATMLGGDIEIVETRAGVGTTFRVTISCTSCRDGRLVEVPRTGAGELSPALSIARAKETPTFCYRVLLAEDGADNRALISRILERAGMEVTLAENGREAVQAALTEPFDVIIMDMQMPVMDGYSAARELRDSGHEGAIIALTANSMEGDRDSCLAAGCDDYQTKPIRARSLIESIRRIVEPHSATG